MDVLRKGFPHSNTIHMEELLAKLQYEPHIALDITTLKGFLSILDSENWLFYDDERNLIKKL